MQKITITLCCLLFAGAFVRAQQPVLKVAGRDSARVKLHTLRIEVSVAGNIATTTMHMQFCNTGSRVLEGELTFPMPDGVSISRYALDINGKMREAVPVEKEKGQVVFETIERQNVDPGLLEKVEGNNFRTRIYPIPANGCRSVLIAYEQELKMTGSNALLYSLPLHSKYPIANFSTSFTIYSTAVPEIGEDCNTNLQFKALKNVFSAQTDKKNFTPNGSFSLQIPKMADAAEVQVQEVNGQYYFLVNSYPRVQPRDKPMPGTLTLLWDASLSGQHRDHTKEYALLDAYFKKAGSMTVYLAQVDFLYKRINTFNISGGDWSALRAALQSTVYDGATNFSSITNWPAAQEALFFTDGLNTWGDAHRMAQCPFPVYTISASANADFSLLRMIAAQTGGGFVNLDELPLETALQQLTRQQLQLIGVEVNGQVSEVYPSITTPIVGNCTVAGISAAPATRIVLQLGYGKTITDSKTIDIDAATQAVANMSLPKIWAQKKIAQLDMQYEVFKNQVTELGKQHGIVTRNTSLIVLDNVADYVRFDIEPPAELKAEYTRLQALEAKREKEAERRTIDQALAFFNDVKKWWDRDFTLGRMPVAAAGKMEISGSNAGNRVTGRVTDAGGNPVKGARVTIGTTRARTNEEGLFTIAKQPAVNSITITAEGYKTLRGNLNGGTVINAALENAHTISQEETAGAAVADTLAYNLSTGESQQAYGFLADRRRPPPFASAATITTLPMRATNFSSNFTVAATAVPFLRIAPGTYAQGFTTGTGDNQSRLDYRGNDQTITYAWRDSARVRTRIERIPDRVTDPDGSRGIFKDTLFADEDGMTEGEANVVEFMPERVYLERLDSAATGSDLYKKYISIREEYDQTPSFYFDVARYFFKKGDTATGLKILSNLADLNLEDHEVFKMLGYQLKALGLYADALPVFKKVLEWRPQEPQSLRDYGLALADAGKYQNALDTLYASLLKNFNGDIANLYPGIEEITVTEINNIIAQHGAGLNTSAIDKRIVKNLPLDVRVVLNWNMNDTDIDLWTIDPNGEKCYYGHKLTRIGARNSNDFTRGYGPEQFMLKQAINGKYEVKLHFFGNTIQKLAGATTVMAEVYTFYGTPQQQRQVIALQMEKGEQQDGILVGEFEFGGSSEK